MKTKYRVATDRYSGYEVQHKKWYYIFWVQTDFINTFPTLEDAIEFIKTLEKKDKKREVIYNHKN